MFLHGNIKCGNTTQQKATGTKRVVLVDYVLIQTAYEVKLIGYMLRRLRKTVGQSDRVCDNMCQDG